jgi:hypothetical protein
MQLTTLQSKIYELRDCKIMLDYDLAELYQLETRVLNQAVKRNSKRFPKDFMFQLTDEEWSFMSSQFVMTSPSKRPKKALPYAFTEQGVAMLSGILNSEVAINVNIAIMRTFVLIRKLSLHHKEFDQKLLELEAKYDKQFGDVYEALNYLIKQEEIISNHTNRETIGYKP